MNTPESDLERAIKHNPAWISLWSRTDEAADEAQVDDTVLRDAYNEAWNAGHYAGEIAGRRQAAIEGGDEGFGP